MLNNFRSGLLGDPTAVIAPGIVPPEAIPVGPAVVQPPIPGVVPVDTTTITASPLPLGVEISAPNLGASPSVSTSQTPGSNNGTTSAVKPPTFDPSPAAAGPHPIVYPVFPPTNSVRLKWFWIRSYAHWPLAFSSIMR